MAESVLAFVLRARSEAKRSLIILSYITMDVPRTECLQTDHLTHVNLIGHVPFY
jgi:hypothetical protein